MKHKSPSIRGLRFAGLQALEYIEGHPGCCIADVDRAVRTARGGHRWMYFTVKRLIRRGLVRFERAGSRILLYALPR